MRPRLWFVFFVFVCKVCAQAEVPARPLVPVDSSGSPIYRSTISKEELRIPHKAIEELQRSQRDYKSGNLRSSVRHLENALRLYPDCLEARNNLGAQYIELKEYEKAITEFRRAIQINDRIVQPFNNLSVAFFKLQRYTDAEVAARHALWLDPTNSIARYVLGCSLAAEDRNAPEALEMLRATKGLFPESRLMIAKILLRQGASEDAKGELRDYLAASGIEQRAVAERWLAQLTEISDTVKYVPTDLR